MDTKQKFFDNGKNPAGAQSRAEGANLTDVLCANHDRDIVPIRLPSGTKAYLDLPRPLSIADATHLCALVVQYIEGAGDVEARDSVNDLLAHNMGVSRNQQRPQND